jgi:hypothetical protein
MQFKNFIFAMHLRTCSRQQFQIRLFSNPQCMQTIGSAYDDTPSPVHTPKTPVKYSTN